MLVQAYRSHDRCLRCNATKIHGKDRWNYPQSRLQIAWRETIWATRFKLHKIHINELPNIGLSPYTQAALTKYNLAVDELRRSILSDYKRYKDYTLKLRENKKDFDT